MTICEPHGRVWASGWGTVGCMTSQAFLRLTSSQVQGKYSIFASFIALISSLLIPRRTRNKMIRGREQKRGEPPMQLEEREKTPSFPPSPIFPEPPTEEVEATQKISAALSAKSDDRGPALIVDEEEKEFEFAFVLGDAETEQVITADEIFSDGQIRPVYPFFSRDLLLLLPDGGGGGGGGEGDHSASNAAGRGEEESGEVIRRLLIEEREAEPSRSSSLSSSSSAELDRGDSTGATACGRHEGLSSRRGGAGRAA